MAYTKHFSTKLQKTWENEQTDLTRPISKASLYEDADGRFKVILKRMEDLTGLTTPATVPFQVIKYGIDGELDVQTDGKRLATLLIHVSA